METTGANVWVAPNRLEWMTLPVPSPPPGGTLLEVTANGICGTDLHFLRQAPTTPLVLGHEIVGRIVAFDEVHPRRDYDGVPLREGDTVALFPWLPCGRCWGCRRFGPGATTCTEGFVYGIPPDFLGLPPLQGDSPSLTGGYGEHLAARDGTCMWRVPPDMPAPVASLLDPLAVAVRAVDVTRTAAGTWDEVLTPDATAVVLGAGGIGLLTALVLREYGVGTVVVSGSRPRRLAAARLVGADLVLDIHEQRAADRVARVQDLTHGRGADLVIDASNSPAALTEALKMVRRLGTVVEVGNVVASDTTVPVAPATDVCRRNVRLLGVSFDPPRSFSEGMALLKRKRLPFEELITRTYPFDHVRSAVDDLAGDVVKVVLAKTP
ncbi:hypothetical protein C6N75_04575 [Streptomyces solincola]|uniref:2-deoxy-scyllo-inosamine dehydrogenase n=1 Tax=Streptomyces solincola TaxID=2100817 RepID=A0A2S9Q143_9ACTN|nr:zinc-binding dehydrogenase [Streptomyces solincola]PRH80368.1 hypothetical protein C6N75_04575 [Streptomyces solincola]